MGVTIHYEGALRDQSSYEQVMAATQPSPRARAGEWCPFGGRTPRSAGSSMTRSGSTWAYDWTVADLILGTCNDSPPSSPNKLRWRQSARSRSRGGANYRQR